MENTITNAELKKIIERLKDEKSKLEEEYESRGKEEGFLWAKSAPIDEILLAIKWAPRDLQIPDNSLSRIIDDIIRKDDFMEIKGTYFFYLNAFANSYFIGWVSGVQTLWERLDGKIWC